jgi:hypothetical protein
MVGTLAPAVVPMLRKCSSSPPPIGWRRWRWTFHKYYPVGSWRIRFHHQWPQWPPSVNQYRIRTESRGRRQRE